MITPDSSYDWRSFGEHVIVSAFWTFGVLVAVRHHALI